MAALAVTAVAYSNALAGPFVWDDIVLIQDDPSVHEIRPISDYFGAGFWRDSPQGKQAAYYYRPLVPLSYAVDWQLWDGKPAGFHLTNVLAHLVAVALVFALALRLGASAAAAFVAAALFGTSPRATENVTWIAGRTDVFAAIGALGALLLHRAGPGGHLRRVGGALALLAGLLCKEVAAAAFVGLAVQTFRDPRSRPIRQLALELLPATAAATTYGILRWHALAGVQAAQTDVTNAIRLALPFEALARYALMLADPLRPRFGIGLLPVINAAFAAGGLVLAAAFAWVGWRRARFWPAPTLGVATTGAVALALVLHIVTLRIHAIACDRFLYVPVATLCAIAAARAASTRWSRPSALAIAGVCVCALVAFPAATLARNALWADDLALWATEASRAAPLDGVIPSEYGNALFRRNQPERALAEFRESLVRFERFEPHSPLFAQFGRRSARTNIATVLSELGEYDEAQRILETIIAEEPAVALHRFNLGVMTARRLEFEMAQRSLKEALRLHPDYPAAQRALGLVRKARDAWRELPPERDGEPTAVRGARAAIFAQLGRWHDAERSWSEVALAPDATRAQLEGAALYLARHAHPDTAVTAIARFEARYGASPEVAALRQLVAGRRDAVR